MVGKGSATVQFGTDDLLFQAVAPPDKDGPAKALKIARGLVKELAETTKPGIAPPDNAPPEIDYPDATSVPQQTSPPYPTPPDPNPAKGMDPNDAPK